MSFFNFKRNRETENSNENNTSHDASTTTSQFQIVNQNGTYEKTTTTTYQKGGETVHVQKKIVSKELPYTTSLPNMMNIIKKEQEHFVCTDSQSFQRPMNTSFFESNFQTLRSYKQSSPEILQNDIFTIGNRFNNRIGNASPLQDQRDSQEFQKPANFVLKSNIGTPPTPEETSSATPTSPERNRFRIPNFFKTQGLSVTSIPDTVNNETSLLIKVKKSESIMTPSNTKLELYPTSSKNRGVIFIINNIKYDSNNSHREGAEVDEKNLVELFKQMSFKMEKYTNKKGGDMKKLITNHRKQSSLSKYDISIVVIMGHGSGSSNGASVISGVDGVTVPIAWIIDEFSKSNCPALNGKPKIFIFQCCRGDSEDVQKDSFPNSREYADILIAYSTIPGFVAYRSPKSGSWYIELLCKVFMEHACDTDVETLLKIVDSQLENTKMDGLRQTSNYENRGFNKLCFINPGVTK